jgi:O-antigen/teichoic acid export membrane protein
VAQGGDLSDAWQRATSVGVIGPAFGAVVMIGLRPIILPEVDFWVYSLLLVSQLNFFWLTELAVYIGNATRRLKEAAQLRLLVVVCRFGALLFFVLFTSHRLIDWAVASIISFALAAGLCVGYIWLVFGAPPSLRRGSVTDFQEGAPFSINAMTESLVAVSDRPLLVRYGHGDDAGIYTLGGRIIQFGYLPVRILLRASDADLFEAGKHGVRPALDLTRRLLRPGIAVGLAVGLGAFIGAPIVAYLIPKYATAVSTIRLLAVMPGIRAVPYLMGNCLSATNLQRWRLAATASGAVLNLGLNMIFLPNGTWRTAVYTTLVSEVFLTSVLIVVAVTAARRERLSSDRQPVAT